MDCVTSAGFSPVEVMADPYHQSQEVRAASVIGGTGSAQPIDARKYIPFCGKAPRVGLDSCCSMFEMIVLGSTKRRAACSVDLLGFISYAVVGSCIARVYSTVQTRDRFRHPPDTVRKQRFYAVECTSECVVKADTLSRLRQAFGKRLEDFEIVRQERRMV